MKVLILGGGVIGTTSAYFLAKQGHDVTVIERQAGVALETSHANAGQISYAYSSPWAAPDIPLKALKWLLSKHSPLVINPKMNAETLKFAYRMLKNCNHKSYHTNKSRMLRISNYAKDCLSEIERDTDIQYEQRKKGFLQILRTDKQVVGTQKDIAVLEQFGTKYKVLDVDGCLAAEPGLKHVKHNISGGLQFEGDATGNCFKFTNELQKKCLELGVSFEFNVTVDLLKLDNGKVTAVKTNKGDLSADKFVVALGSYSAQLLRPVGIDIPVYPVKGYSITVPVLNDEDAPQSTVMDETYKVAITRLGNNIRAAGTAELTGYNLSLREKSRATVRHSVQSLFPHAADMSDDQFWTGLRPMTPDGTPVIGKTPISNLFLNTGHGTLGWTMSAGSGKLIADIVSGNETAISLDGLEMSRYPYANKAI
ncbi:MAG: D-amino acid dehydrogenase [Gammaproteobacteria bacterium]|nr:D-amino acid dehydrogenase [Gammaproteobacteria bacterium]